MSTARPLALVTGASSGIGFELARLFATHGHDLVVAADDDAIYDVPGRLGDTGARVQAVEVDLRERDAVDALYAGIEAPLAAAALNAGSGRAGRFIDADVRTDLDIVDLNVRSTVLLAKPILRDMADRGTGRVLFTSSLVAMMPGSYQSMYNASKSFVQSFSEALSDEMRSTGVTVTALMPGPVHTEFFRRAAMLDTLLGRLPIKDSAAEVARKGFEAMMRGDRRVVAASPGSKLAGALLPVLPDALKAAANRLIATPRSGLLTEDTER
jgi:uncharacterized protein